MPQQLSPNRQLRKLLVQASWTGQDLATAVNAIGRETSLALRYDRSAVAHWLAGTRPRPSAAALIAEALSRRLGRTITQEHLGFTTSPGAASSRSTAPGAAERPGTQDEEESVTTLVRLAQAQTAPDHRRRQLLVGLGYSLTALAVPGFDSRPAPDAPARDAPAQDPLAQAALAQAARVPRSRADKVTLFEVEAAEALAVHFRAGDAAFGGGHGRRALAAYLASDLAPRLRRPASPAVRSRLLAAAGRLAYLCAFMCFDDELHGYAQRYYRVALRLATENRDALDYAVALRGMSVQARVLGHYHQAVELAEAAAANTPGQPLRQAFVHGQLAVAAAADRDPHRALAAIGTAERFLDRATGPQTQLTGAYHWSSLLHQQGTVRELLGDRAGAIGALRESLRHRPTAERRSRAIILAELAELQLDEGRLDQAVATWNQFLDEYPTLASARSDTAVAILRARVRPHGRNPAARALLERTAVLAAPRPHPRRVGASPVRVT